MNGKITKAIFPMAGLGTRFLPASKSIPKEMLTILDRPIIEWAVIEASKAGIKEMIFVLSANKNSILEHFSKTEMLELTLKKKKKLDKLKVIQEQNNLGQISIVIQDEPKGLGHAVWCARNLVSSNESFAVILPDDIILSKTPAIKQLIKIYKKTNYKSVIGLEKVPLKEVSKYGVIKIKEKKKNFLLISNLVEKPKISQAPSNLAIVGRYIIDSKIFKFLDFKKKGHGNEIQLTDGLNFLAKNSEVYGVEFDGKRFDCGQKLGFIEANVNFGLNDSEIKSKLKKILKKL